MKPDRAVRRAGLQIALMSVLLALSAAGFASDEPASGAPSAAADYRDAVEQLAGMVQDELDRGIIPGVSIALVDDQRVVLATGWGWADKRRKTPAAATTVYRVGSISKLFTALAAMQLVEQGRLDLDAPLGRYLPDLRIQVPFENAAAITLRQLMCHRSGMVRESPVGGYLDDSQPGIAATLASLESCALVNPPNTKTRYSNVGPTIVGQAVAAVSGMPFEEYQQEHLLQPLGMQHSAWRMNGQLRKHLAIASMRVADGRGGFDHREAPQFELGTIPAGNLYSTAEDMARFAKMLLAGGQTAGGRIVSAKALQEMSKPQLIGESSGFGLGFFVSDFAGHRTIQHNGAVYGFTSSLVVLPEPKIAAIVLVNEDIALGPVRRLSDAALSLMLQAKTGQSPEAQPEPLPRDAEQLAALAGDYESPGYWAEIRVVEGRLQANIAGQPMALTAVEPEKFEADGRFVHRAVVEFQTGDDGRATGFTALGQTFTRVAADSVREIPAAYEEYLGNYGPDFIPLVVSARHGHLYAMTENMVDYRLTPVNQLVFRMPEGLYADEYLVFQLSRDGQVQSVNLANMTLPRNP